MLSMITPPVALAAFAAANISKAGLMETGWTAVRIGWAMFVLPFMFVLSPTLLMQGKSGAIIFDSITATIGIYLSVGHRHWLHRAARRLSCRAAADETGLIARVQPRTSRLHGSR